MRLQDLQDQLRAHIRARIDRGELTGSSLSRQAGFQQGHLSNFLNARRGLSLESMDRLLETLQIESARSGGCRRDSAASARSPAGRGLRERCRGLRGARRPLPRFTPEQVRRHRQLPQVVSAQAEAQRCLRPRRLAALRADQARPQGGAAACFRGHRGGATLLIDRHYTSLHPYRRLRPNLYAVRLEARCSRRLRFAFRRSPGVAAAQSAACRWNWFASNAARSYSDYIVGRVCHVAFEV